MPAFLRLNLPPRRPRVPAQPIGQGIPRVIHQTHRDWDALPPELHAAIARLRAANPGWQYRFHDDAAVEAYIAEAYGPSILARFRRIDPRYGAARADLFRYLLMYRDGGVYLDIKSTADRPLDEILQPDDRLVLCQWPPTGRFEGAGRHDWDFAGIIEGSELQQWHILAASGHPYLHAVIEAVLRNIDRYVPGLHGAGNDGVLRLTGPIAYTLAIAPLLPLGLHRRVADHEALGLRYSIAEDNTWHLRLSPQHYSALASPIVRPRLLGRGLDACFRLYTALRGR